MSDAFTLPSGESPTVWITPVFSKKSTLPAVGCFDSL